MKVRRMGLMATSGFFVLAALMLFVGTVMAYGRREVLDTPRFTQRATAVLHTDEASTLLAVVLTRQAIESGSPDLVALRPLVESNIERLIASGNVDGILNIAISEMHRSMFSPEAGPLVLSMKDLLVVTQGVVRALSPEAADAIPVADTVGEVRLGDNAARDWTRRAQQVRWLGVLLPVLGLVLLGAAIALARDRRRAVIAAGFSLAGAGVLVVLAVAIIRPFVMTHFEGSHRDVAREVWNGIIGDLGHWGLLLFAVGALVAAAGSALLPHGDVMAGVAFVRRLAMATPSGRPGQVIVLVRAAVAIGLGLIAVLDWETAARLAATVVGAIAIIWGLSEVLRMAAPDEAQIAKARETGRSIRRGAITSTGVGALAVAGLLTAGGFALASDGGGPPLPAPRPQPCNGHVELCDRPLDQVAFATSHNAMSVAVDPGWFNAHHYNPLVEQLDGGVRGLQIDTYLGQETREPGFGGTRLVRTDLSGSTRSQIEAEIGPEALAAAERLAGRIFYGSPVERPRLFLCHGLCEIGATDAVEEYTRIREWVDDHPDQVLIIIIQDAADIDDDVDALIRSGLAAKAWPTRLGKDTPMPTLREMIAIGKTVVIAHESLGTNGPPWYQSTYDELFQETGFAHPSVQVLNSEESCAPLRGPDDGPLFMLNHWLARQPVSVGESRLANARDMLLGRAQRCGKLRGRLANLVAVNFVEIGDLLPAVDALNGVEEAVPPVG